MGTESVADIGKAAQALASALPGIVTAAQPGACLASLNMSSMLHHPDAYSNNFPLMIMHTALPWCEVY